MGSNFDGALATASVTQKGDVMADGDPLVIGGQNNGIEPTLLSAGDGEFAVGFEVVTRGVATIDQSAALIGRSPDQRKGVLGIGQPGVKGEPSAPSGDGVSGSSPSGRGVEGQSDQGYGVAGVAGNVGVYAHNSEQGHEAYLGSRCCAGDFYGDVSIHGSLTKSGGGFLIDHPQDPGNKYLSHSFVESSDMKNLYDGVSVLGTDGDAVVELPSWVEALNTDFRYQLTPVGAPAPDLHIAEEIADSRFTIAGGPPELKVSWLVTGVRHDPWARAHSIPSEHEKSESERGTYLHPELLGESREKSLAARRYPAGSS